MTHDEQHLRWLSIGHYIVAALSAVHLLFFWGVLGVAGLLLFRITTLPGREPASPVPPFIVAGALLVILLGFSWAVLEVVGTFLAGRYLAARKHHRFCFVVAALRCSYFPFGTLVGVLTIFVLSRYSVKALFTRNLPLAPPGGTAVAAPT